MSKPSKRANREERKADKKKLLAAQKILREQQKKDGTYQPQTSVSNKQYLRQTAKMILLRRNAFKVNLQLTKENLR